VKSSKALRKLKEQYGATMIFGHDLDTVKALGFEEKVFQ
jgi:hypothetical protein